MLVLYHIAGQDRANDQAWMRGGKDGERRVTDEVLELDIFGWKWDAIRGSRKHLVDQQWQKSRCCGRVDEPQNAAAWFGIVSLDLDRTLSPRPCVPRNQRHSVLNCGLCSGGGRGRAVKEGIEGALKATGYGSLKEGGG